MADSAPRVSVCIPVFNCADFVGQAVASVLEQTWKDLDLVVLDNNSTDATREVVAGYRDPRLRLIRNETNVGVEGNWNKALRAARGKYLKLVCADDYLYPTCLARQVALLDSPDNAGVVMTCCTRDIVDDRGRRILTRGYPGRSGRYRGQEAIRRAVRRGTNVIGEVSGVLFRTEALAQAGEFDGQNPYVIDLDFWCRMLLQGDLYVLAEPLCTFRVSAGSWSVNLRKSQTQAINAFIDKLRQDPRYRLTWLDCLFGRIMARVNMQARQFIYRRIVRAGTAAKEQKAERAEP